MLDLASVPEELMTSEGFHAFKIRQFDDQFFYLCYREWKLTKIISIGADEEAAYEKANMIKDKFYEAYPDDDQATLFWTWIDQEF